jgi:hypothetical protein
VGRFARGRRARTGLLVGGLAMSFAILVAYLASLIGFTFAPDALAQSVIEVLPGAIAVPLIELLQFWAKRLLVAGVLIASLGGISTAAALFGLIYILGIVVTPFVGPETKGKPLPA